MANNKSRKKGQTKSRKDESFDREEATRGNKGSSNPRGNNKGNGQKPQDSKESGKSAYERVNDPEFWMGCEQSYNAANYTTDQPYGAPFPSPEAEREDFTPAGIARYDYIPYFGHLDGALAPLNYVAKILYDEINSKNSRDWSYDPSDLMIYIIAVAQLHAFHAFVLRIIGLFNQYYTSNRHVWRPLLESMDIMEPDFKTTEGVNTLSAWRDLANNMAIAINIFPVPDNIRYFNRASYMCTNIYVDENTPKSSLSYFSPCGFLRYEYDGDNIGRLVFRDAPWWENPDKPRCSTDDIWSYFKMLVANLTNDTDISKIGTDLLRCFGEENLRKCQLIDPSFTTGLVYDPEFGEMIHNARVCYQGYQLTQTVAGGTPVYSYEQDMLHNCIKLASGEITVDSTLPDAWMMTKGKPIPLDFWTENPDQNRRMYVTRLTWYPYIEKSGSTTTYYINAATELIVKDTFFEMSRNPSNDWVLNKLENCLVAGVGQTLSSAVTTIDKASRVAKFNNAPINWIVQWVTSGEGYVDAKFSRIMCDLRNFTTLSLNTLKRLHDAACISIFLPRSGRKVANDAKRGNKR